MKLLSKQQASALKEKEKQVSIEEGLKIARRVDNLREVAAREEESLSKFRVSTLAAIQEEIDTKDKYLQSLKSEVSLLEKRKQEALAPITRELTMLEKRHQELQEKEREISIEVYSLEATKEGIAETIKGLKQDELRIQSNQRLTYQALLEAENLSAQARSDSQEVNQLKVHCQEIARKVEEEYNQQTTSFKATESRQKKRDEEQDKRDVALNKRETKLKDREEAFSRKITRLKK